MSYKESNNNLSCKGCEYLKFAITLGYYCNKDGIIETNKGELLKVICPLENENIIK